MSDPILYDDEYTGPRYRYGLTYRPLAYGAVPNGYIVFSLRPATADHTAHPERYPHGLVDYPRELTAQETAAYQLTLVAFLPGRCSNRGHWISPSQPGDWWTDQEAEDGRAPGDAYRVIDVD